MLCFLRLCSFNRDGLCVASGLWRRRGVETAKLSPAVRCGVRMPTLRLVGLEWKLLSWLTRMSRWWSVRHCTFRLESNYFVILKNGRGSGGCQVCATGVVPHQGLAIGEWKDCYSIRSFAIIALETRRLEEEWYSNHFQFFSTSCDWTKKKKKKKTR